MFVRKTIVFKEWTFYERESRKNRNIFNHESEVNAAATKTGKDKTASLADLGLSIETSSGIAKSSTNNYMYGAEIEYILYGDFDAVKNVQSAKSMIFCI